MKNKIALITALFITAAAGVNCLYADDNGTEFGVADDLSVFGTEGNMMDPDVEIKGFTLFGSTGPSQAVYIPQAPGNIFVSGYIQVSSGAYFVGSSTFSTEAYFISGSTANFSGKVDISAPANIFIGGGADGQVLVKDGTTGAMKWATTSDLPGDNLGNHTATQDLNMNSWNIVNVSSVNFMPNVYITTAPASQYGGLFISTHVYLSSNTYIAGNTDISKNASVGGTLDVTGAAILNNGLTVNNAPATINNTLTVSGQVTAQNGISVTGGNVTINNNLTVNGNTTLGDGVNNWTVAKSSFTVDPSGASSSADSSAAFVVKGSANNGEYTAKFYSGPNESDLAAWIRKKP